MGERDGGELETRSVVKDVLLLLSLEIELLIGEERREGLRATVGRGAGLALRRLKAKSSGRGGQERQEVQPCTHLLIPDDRRRSMAGFRSSPVLLPAEPSPAEDSSEGRRMRALLACGREGRD